MEKQIKDFKLRNFVLLKHTAKFRKKKINKIIKKNGPWSETLNLFHFPSIKKSNLEEKIMRFVHRFENRLIMYVHHNENNVQTVCSLCIMTGIPSSFLP